ncbi:hypothetical protein ACHWQZ_G005741 [Mnemiopsis leidyi]
MESICISDQESSSNSEDSDDETAVQRNAFIVLQPPLERPDAITDEDSDYEDTVEGNNQLNEQLVDLLHSAANSALKVKKPPYSSSHKKWFDFQCRISKRNLGRLANRLANAELRAKALRALYGLKGNIIKDALSHKSICILFDSLIKPILLYGCQVVGPHSKTIKYISNLSCESDPTLALKYIANDHYEKFHLKFIKWSLSVHSKSSNIGCWGETGRAPLIYEVCKLSMDFFTRAKDSDNVLVSAAFQEQANLDLPWYSNLSKLINKYQFQANLRANVKQSTLITHLMKEEFVDNWKQAKADSPKLEFYNKIKSEFGPEKYLTLVRDPEARKSLTRFRISAHNLFIERGRYETPIIPRADRTCIFCSVNFGAKSIEDEHHVLVGCPLYRTVKIKSGFYPSSDCALVDSLSNQDISPKDATKIAKTVHAILTTNTAYTNYYKSNGFHIIYDNCIIL